MQSKNFTFKCHRDGTQDIYAVNSISFHSTFGTFVTAGADGNYNFWDKDSKQRLKNMTKCSAPFHAVRSTATARFTPTPCRTIGARAVTTLSAPQTTFTCVEPSE